MQKNIFIIFGLLLLPILPVAQPVGTIRGIVTDAASGQAMPFVSIMVPDSDPLIGTITDTAGHFRLSNLPVGRYTIQSSFIGYETAIFREILVGSGREVVLEIEMREDIHQLGEVTIRPRVDKERPLNTMALVGARMFSVEETGRYAGGFDDPARMASAFAGVAGSMNSNGIVIRGNSPKFTQWRIGGIEAINPTHFSDITGVGGGILTALSSQMLSNSDFFTGAFPAEYGNALSGVFDMRLRSGNNQTHEHTAQVGTLGVEVSSEGPFRSGGQASYLFNYRYSSMALIGDLLPDLAGGAAGMRYQGLSFKLNLPTRNAGTFSVWGIGIRDHFINRASKDTADWWDIWSDNSDFRQTKGVGGIDHRIFLNNRTYLRNIIAANYTRSQIDSEQIHFDGSIFPIMDMSNTNWNIILNSYLNTTFSTRHTNKTGFTVTNLFYNLDYWMSPDWLTMPPSDMVNFTNDRGHSVALSAYTQSLIRVNSRLTANVGLHSMYFHLNGNITLEPRVSARWQAFPRHWFGLAYGKHSRRENIDYYFVRTPETGDKLVNRNLGFSKAHHFVASYDWMISENLRLRIEPYFQHLFNIPVQRDSLFSLINFRDWFLMIPLVNDGRGRNFGIDFTLERFLNNGFYFLFTTSVFQSRYMGGDGVWRNTRFNRNFTFDALGGKEWVMGRQSRDILSVNLRFSIQGGERIIPINEQASISASAIVFDNSRAFNTQLPTEFIGHLSVSYTMNRNRVAHKFSLQMANITGNQEFGGYFFNYREGRPQRMMDAVVIPNISYRIQF
ncbi:MAG: TonB-dependent receptor [Bacteroidales bacterium]|nr:TonB-dependent receptor [Bacteroidales bacterium]